MANGVRLDVVTDTSQVKKGLKDVEDAFEDVGDTLDKVGKEGEDVGEDLERSFSELARETKKDAKAMASDVEDSYKKMDRGANEATKQMSADAASEAEQVASSFDGSAESIVDGFQGAAASMFSGFGPAGAAAGLAAAAGLGLISAELEKQKEKAAESAAAQWDLAQEIIDAGTYAVTESMKVDLLKEWLGDEDAQKEAKKTIEDLGITASDFGAAMLDIGDKREEVEDRIREVYADQRKDLDDLLIPYEARNAEIDRINDAEEKALGLITDTDDVLNGAVKTAVEFGETMAQSGLTLDGNKAILDETEKTILRMAETDATPTFDFQSWYDGLDEFQRRLLQLRAPTLDVQVRTVR